jgi:hypothetical protein
MELGLRWACRGKIDQARELGYGFLDGLLGDIGSLGNLLVGPRQELEADKPVCVPMQASFPSSNKECLLSRLPGLVLEAW